MESLKFIVVGAGSRGQHAYSRLIKQFQHILHAEVVAVADINEDRRKSMMETFSIPQDLAKADYRDIFSKDKFADAVIVATQDADHFTPAKLALEKGYHVLLEKPISNKLEECVALKKIANKYPSQHLAVCHVLRYTPYFRALKQVIDSGEIGEICAINHNENVGYFHFAHSFVRGNWRNKEESSPLILAKSCHDLDLLLWLVGKSCISVSAHGGLKHFKTSKAPEGSSDRCVSCKVESTCPYSAKQIYLETYPAWGSHIVSKNPTRESVLQALETSPYGRCVYRCDNNVVDHMSISLEFEDNITAVFSLSAFTNEINRTIKIMGTKGEIRGHFEKSLIEVRKFGSEEYKVITPKGDWQDGHGGGDWGIISDFCKAIRSKGEIAATSIDRSLESHVMAFAIEESYLNRRVYSIKEFYESLN